MFDAKSWCWLTLSLCIAFSRGSPTSYDIQLARKYAPQWRFHPDEIYYPSTVEKFLSGPFKLLDKQGNVVLDPVNVENLGNLPNQTIDTFKRLFLTTDIEAGKGGFLLGQNPSKTPSKAYAFVVPRPNNIIDIYYWLFTPFNYGKDTFFGHFGDHVADWEYMIVRTVNGEATQINYHAHDDSGGGILPWAQALKFDGGQRPAAYVAFGSHGFWNTVGTFTYLDLGIVKLKDVTADGGAMWDVQDDLQVYKYPDTYSSSDNWLNFKGAWGNKGGLGRCYPRPCVLDGGPPGPNREDYYERNTTKDFFATTELDLKTNNSEDTSNRLIVWFLLTVLGLLLYKVWDYMGQRIVRSRVQWLPIQGTG